MRTSGTEHQSTAAGIIKEVDKMNSYEEKQEAKRNRLLTAADNAEAKSNAAFDRADLSEERSGIPLGQPILVGHHSEKRHRRALERSDNAMRQAVDQSKRAGNLRARAAAIGTGGISSDDPEAVTKLKAKVAKLEQTQSMMKTSNRIVRKYTKKGVSYESSSEDLKDFSTELSEALEMVLTEENVRAMLEPDFCGRIGFASYKLTNNNAKIKQAKKRLADLEAASTRETVERDIEGICKLVHNTDENRVQFIFDGKPSDKIRDILKLHAFRWAPSNKAWQRHLNNTGIFHAEMALKQILELSSSDE